ncbi:MAG: alcohol dehydrogenase catalytic domain-containing protein [Rhodobacteraceae bacterium]|nr:alcohol dehydrogenase catalytic domain-containing protein [Paracoccaceae bacterium]
MTQATALPDTMTALILREGGYSGAATGPRIARAADWLEAVHLPVPQPAPGEVLIRVALSPVNPSDLHFIKGEYGQPRVAGQPAGFEGTGVVAALGEGVPEALQGTRVAFVATRSGAWAEYAVTDASLCIPLRPYLREEDAAALIVNPLTAVAMIEEASARAGGAVVLTAAASQLGRLMIGLAADRGIAAVAIIRGAERAEALRALGAAEVLDVTAPDFEAGFAAMVRAHKPRMLLDAGADDASARMFFAMPARSVWTIYGKLDQAAPALDQAGQFIFMGKKIEGFWLSDWLRRAGDEARIRAVTEAQERFASGAWQTRVATTLPLAEALEALAPALAEADGKVMIRP